MGTWDKAGAYEYEEPTCGCATGPIDHRFGAHVDCEYFNHHCEACHEKKICTKAECRSARQ